SPARSAGPSWQPVSGSSPPSTRGKTCKSLALLLRIPNTPLGRIRMAGAGRQPRALIRTSELTSKSNAQAIDGDCLFTATHEVGRNTFAGSEAYSRGPNVASEGFPAR